jgi:UDP-N-acetylmuramate--alanine ligase
VAPELTDTAIDASLAMFRGTWRRFEYKGQTLGGADLYDDYAHHPTAIHKTITAAREKFPGKQVIVFFHPHLYSRTRDLFDEFATALATADQAYVLPVFAAREPHDAAVSNVALAGAIEKKGGKAEAVGGLEETTEKIKSFGAGVLVFTMGAGDVYKAGEQALAK